MLKRQLILPLPEAFIIVKLASVYIYRLWSGSGKCKSNKEEVNGIYRAISDSLRFET
jgi:hypothetical protein